MAWIRALCPDCSDVEFHSTGTVVRHCTSTDTWAYRFRCPACGRMTVHDCSAEIADVLITAGCRVEQWVLPSREAVVAEPLTADDLLEMRDSLPNFLENLLS